MARASPRPEHHPFTKAVARALRKRCGVAGGDRLIVATSGGCDSVALLRALAALAPRRSWCLNLAVAHVQHHLRPDDEAEADAAFVARLAGQLDLPFLRADLTPPGPRDRAINREDWARRSRYAALAEMAGAFDARAILTAHHADDQLETLLMRLLRGASVRGLAGIAWRRRMTTTQAGASLLLLRPMLGVDRTAVRGFLNDIAQGWREDQTNRDVTRLRARLRRDVLPPLRQVRPDAAARAVALGDHLRQAARLLEHAVATAADRVTLLDGQDLIHRADARLMEGIVLGGLLRHLLIRRGAGCDRLGRRTLAPIIRAARDTRGGRRTFSLGNSLQIAVTRDVVSIGTAKAVPSGDDTLAGHTIRRARKAHTPNPTPKPPRRPRGRRNP